MKNTCFAASVALSLLAALVSTSALAAAGRTPGNFAVSPSGSATYSIPIWAPPGPNGLQPQIGLVYDSRGGTGSEGVGWSLAGLSSIYLCNQTIAQDGVAAAVGSGSQRFCMDGKRLRLTSGSDNLSTYGEDGTTYQTEVADFSNVTAHGSGPASFTVQLRNGLTYEYGHTSDSLVLGASGAPLAWMLDKVTDRAGNTMVISWVAASSTLSGTTIPASISWTPTSYGASQYSYTMLFNYTVLSTAQQAGYVDGEPIQNFNQLTSIEIQHSSSDVKAYMLDYSVSGTTGQEILTQVTECTDTTRANCLSPTAMTYQPGQQGVTSSAASSMAAAAAPTFAFDLNGDGVNDYVTYTSAGTVQVAFGSASGYQTPVPTPITSANYSVGYIDGTGTASLLTAQAGAYVYYKWDKASASFVANPTGVSVTSMGWPFSFPILADVNGDGLDDLVYSNSSGELFVQLNTTPRGGPVTFAAAIDAGTSNPVTGNPVNNAMYALPGVRKFDFTGDGQADLLILWVINVPGGTASGWNGLHFNGSRFVAVAAGAVGQPGSVVDVGDYNDDGCMDVLYTTGLSLSGCNGSIWSSLSFGSSLAVAGLNWDGGTRRAAAVNNGGQIQIYKSLGGSFASPISAGISYDSTRSYTAAPNPTGDGLDALAAYGGSSTPAQYYLHNGAGQPPDLLSSVTDGYGNFAKPTYVSIAQSSYTEGTSTPAAGYENYIGPMYVVNQATYSDPSSSGGTYQETFTYNTGWMNLQGRGFDGFNYRQSHDSRTGTYEQFGTALGFPASGMFAFDQPSFDQAANQPIRFTFANVAATTLDSATYNQRYFVFLNNITSLEYQVSWNASSGSSPGPLITTTSTDYMYDNWGNALTVARTVTDNDSNSPYSGQQWTTTTTTSVSPDLGTNWCLNQPTEVVTTKTSPGSSVTRTTSFTPDYAHCRMTAKTTEPSSPYYAQTDSYTYDTFGNLTDINQTGIGISPARDTHTDWGTTGQFPMTVKNPLLQATTFNYDFGLGFRISAQDPNGILTTWAPDAFGRKQTQTRPDGTSTGWTYSDCASSGGCLIGSHGLVVVKTVYNSDHTVQTDATAYLDSADRPLVSIQRLLAGGSYQRTEVRYDSLGRVAQQAIPCTWAGLGAACTHWVTDNYDLLNRLTTSQRPISASNPSLQTTTVQYSGRTTTTTDPQGVVSTKISSVDGEMVRSVDNTGYYQNFVYDAFGSLLSVTDSLSNTLFTADYAYGIGAFQLDATDADLDVSTASGQHRTFSYDALGEVTDEWDAKSQHFTQSYDSLGRPLVRTEPDLTTTWTWGASATSFNIGKLQGVSAGSYAESYGYDSAGRLASRSVTIPSDNSYEYDFAYSATTGLLDTLTYPALTGISSSPLKLQYGYTNGFLSSVSDFNSGTHYWTANAANARNQVTQETLGNGVVTNRSFDAVTGWPGSVTSGVNGATNLQNDSYLFDEVGNVIQRENNNPGLTENFYYDGDYRLDHSTLGGTSNVNLQMHYDATGNITSRSDLAGGASWTYDPNRKHAVTQAGNPAFAYTYDQNGNVTSRDGYTVTWTSYNHPSSITSFGESVSFAYKQDHTRYSAVYNGSSGMETTYFIGDLLEKVISAGSVNYRHYIYAGPTKIAIYTPTSAAPQIYYVREDHLGSVSGILNSDGTSYVKESFTAFGARRSSCTWSGPPTAGNLQAIDAVTRHGFTWQTALGAMGLNDMNGRIEDSVTGRFLSPDPFVPDASNTQDFNRYSYARNNPLTYMDPTGFDALHCDWNSGEGHACIAVPDVCTGSRLSCGGQEGWCSGGGSCAGFDYANGSLSDGQLTAAAGVSAAALAAAGFAASASGAAASSYGAAATSTSQPQGDSGPADITINADRYHPDDGLFPVSVVLPGVSAWTNIGNIANGLAYAALVHANPALAGRLRRERPVPGGGAVDFLLDNSLAFELKPYWWQYGPNYSSAQDQLNGYLGAGGYTAGTWADLGIGTQTVGVSGTFSGYGLTVNGTFVFGYDMQSRSSGLLFYMFSGSYSFQRGSPGGGGNMTFYP